MGFYWRTIEFSQSVVKDVSLLFFMNLSSEQSDSLIGFKRSFVFF